MATPTMNGLLTVRGSLAQIGAGAGLMALNLVAAAFFFSYGIEALLRAWVTPEYSHGPVIPLLSAYMFLREMKSVPPAAGPVTDRGPGVALVIFALAMGLLGLLVQIPDIVTYALILWVGGTVLLSFGLRRGWYFWPSVLHLVFMLPLPQFIYWPVSIWLQMVSSRIGVDIVAMFGVPVYLDGNVIDLGIYQLQVAEACSGLRYLFPVMSFSYVFGVLYRGPVWHKLVLLLSAAPITVLMNSVRIGIVGVLVDQFGIQHAEGFLHLFEGWVIFVACVMMLFGLAWAMRRIQGLRGPLGESIDLDFDGIGTQMARFGEITRSTALVTATGATIAFAALWFALPERAEVRPERESFASFPTALGDWQVHPTVIAPQILHVLRADDHLAATLRASSGGAPVDLFIPYYHKLTEGHGIHSPEVCLPAGGWEVSALEARTVPLDGGREITLNRALITKGPQRQIVWYWFEQRGRQVTNDFAAKFHNISDALSRGRTDGALVRLMTPLARAETEAAGDARIEEVLALLVPELPRYLPE